MKIRILSFLWVRVPLAKTLTAMFNVSGVPFPAGSVTVTGYNGKFDGKGHGITLTTTDVENPMIACAGMA